MTSAERKALKRIQGTGNACAVNLAIYLKTREKRRKPSLRKAEKEEKKLSKKRETAALRALVFERAQGVCELLGSPYVAEELHHLENGSGRRLQLQAVENCMAVSRLAHRLYHDDPSQFRIAIEEWCWKYGYPMPSKFRRMA